MEKILTKLYSYEYFSTYLIVAIIVLMILFVLVLFMGKKDQRKREIEATKKLMAINENELQDQFTLEEPTIKEDNKLEDTILVPNINSIVSEKVEVPKIEEIPEPVLPPKEEVTINSEDSFKEEDTIKNVEIPNLDFPEFKFEEDKNVVEPVLSNEISEPVLTKEEEKPFVFDDMSFNIPDEIKIDESLKEIKPVENTIVNDEIKVPEFNYDDILRSIQDTKEEVVPKVEEEKKEYVNGPQIFSSVYVPEREVVTHNPQSDDEEDIELPTLKKEQEDVVNIPKLNDYNINDIAGESYDIR